MLAAPESTAMGALALNSAATGGNDSAFGYSALSQLSDGTGNTAVGSSSLSADISGSANTAVGFRALKDETGGSNTAVGSSAMNENVSGVGNTAVGTSALAVSTGSENSAFGSMALAELTIGDMNIALGRRAGRFVESGSYNIEIFDEGSGSDGTTDGTVDPTTGPTIRIGTQGTQTQAFVAGIFGSTPVDASVEQAVVIDDNGQMGSVPLSSLTTGATGDVGPTGPAGLDGTGVDTDLLNDTGAGANALANLDGVNNSNNTAFGASSLNQNSAGSNNTGIGSSALLNNLVGTDNTAVGQEALYNSTGSFNIGIGSGAGFGLANGNGNIDIFNGGVPSDGTTDGSVDPTSGPTIRIGEPAVHTQTFIAGIYGAATITPSMDQAVVVDPSGNLGSIEISSLTTWATGDTGPTGATGKNGMNGTGVDTDGLGDTGGGSLSLAQLGGLTNSQNTAFGEASLYALTGGAYNTATGYAALHADVIGTGNTADGVNALYQATGNSNIGLGGGAGFDVTTGNSNIEIYDQGSSSDGTTDGSVDPTTGPAIRIGTEGTQTQTFIAGIYGATTQAPGTNEAVVVDDAGNLGSVDVGTLVGPTGATGAAGADSTVPGPTGPSGADSTVAGPQGATGATGADSTVAGPGGPTGATGATGLGLVMDGNNDTAGGTGALTSNNPSFGAEDNTALGSSSLNQNTGGYFNSAVGSSALLANQNGVGNTALGYEALISATGSSNIGIGTVAGFEIGSGSSNIEIGNLGNAADGTGTGTSGPAIRLGTEGTQTQTFVAGISGVTVAGGAEVYVDSNGQLGTVTSSQRFKTDIRDMGSDSDALLALRPVTFRYKPELDPKGKSPQYGLVAEEVEKVSPDLVVRDKDNKAYSVRYNAVNAMLLNEFRKQHEKVETQEKTIADLQGQVATLTAAQRQVAAQQAEITALKAQFEALAKSVANK